MDRGRIELPLHACKAHVLPLSLTAQKLVLGIGNDPISAPYQDAANPFQLTEHIFNLLSILYALEGRNGYGIRSTNCSGCPTTVHLTLAVTASNFTSGTPPIRACLAWAQGSRYLFHVVLKTKNPRV